MTGQVNSLLRLHRPGKRLCGWLRLGLDAHLFETETARRNRLRALREQEETRRRALAEVEEHDRYQRFIAGRGLQQNPRAPARKVDGKFNLLLLFNPLWLQELLQQIASNIQALTGGLISKV